MKQAEIDQSAADTLSRATPITQQLNAAVKDFYQEASGGRAARSNHSMTASLQTVAELRRQLNDVIADSNSLVAASSANHPTLDSWRNNLVQSRKAVDVWLKDANAYAAGLTGPGGKPTATPALPLPPKVVLSTPGSKLSATQEAAAIQQRYDSANAVLQRSAVKPVSAAQGAGGIKTPKLELVTRMPASVKYTASVWVNTTTGEASATARSGSDWLKGTVGTNAMPMSDDSSNGVTGAGKPRTGTYNLNQFFFQPEQDPDPKKKVNLAAIATGVFVLSSAGGLAFSVYQHVRSESTAREDRAEAAWQPSVALQAMPVKGELPGTNAQGAQIVATWQHFLGQAPAVLRANGASEKSVAAFQAASTAFINGQLLPVQAQLQRTTDPKAKSQLLQAMANLKFPALSVAVDPADPRASRTTKTLVAVGEAIKDGVNNSLSLILNSAAAPKPLAATPTVNAAPPTQQNVAPAVTPLAPKETAQQQQARLKALVDRATPQARVAVPPTPAITPPTVATQAPKTQPRATTPTAPTVSPTPSQPAPPVTAKTSPPDSKAALNRISKLVADAGLTNPPSTGRWGDIKFTRDMFINPAQQGDGPALLAAIGQARKLFDAVGEVWKSSSPAVKEEINRGPWASINAVLGDLTNRYNNAKPAAPTESPGTPDAVPAEPTPSPRPVSEPAMP